MVITCCEGLKDENGEYVTSSKRDIDTDKFGHKQLGGVGEFLVGTIASNLKIKARCDKPATIQRVSQVCVSKVDAREAYEVGSVAVQEAISGKTDYMVILKREAGAIYKCTTSLAKLEDVANKEKKVPKEFINSEGNFVSEAFLNYAKPLIGEPLPKYARLEKIFIPKLV